MSNWTEDVQLYSKAHQNRVNQFCHLFGIPLVLSSFLLVFVNWKWGVGFFISGWLFQFIGHSFEHKAPAFLANPKYLFVGVLWWARKIVGH